MGNEQPMKLCITHPDGRTESHDVFIAVVASGLLPAGKADGGRVFYLADGEHFSVNAVCSIAADTAVVASLLQGLFQVTAKIVGSADPGAALELLAALETLELRKTVVFEDIKIIRKNPEEN